MSDRDGRTELISSRRDEKTVCRFMTGNVWFVEPDEVVQRVSQSADDDDAAVDADESLDDDDEPDDDEPDLESVL